MASARELITFSPEPETIEANYYHHFRAPTVQQRFLTSTIRNLQPDTTILALCGVTSIEDADPKEDGWFFSDMFAFNYLLKGTGASQTWLSALDPRDLVERYGEYAHGSPKAERKIVLNKQLLHSGELTDVEVIPSDDDLRRVFLERLEIEAKTAKEDGRSVVIFLFGHGDEASHGFIIGDASGLMIQTSDVAITTPPGLDLTVISTACYSGGWVVSRCLDSTCMGAANPKRESHSWPESGSAAARFAGSMFATEVINQLTGSSSPLLAEPVAEPAAANPSTEGMEKTETYIKFTDSIRNAIMRSGGLFAKDSDTIFSAQKDDWEAPWSARTGIPVAGYEKRWACLTTLPPSGTTGATAIGSLGSHFPIRPVPQRLRMLRKLVKQHLGSQNLEIVWSRGYGHQQRNRLRRFLSNPHPTKEEIENIHNLMEYYYYSMNLADGYLSATGIPAPLNSTCAKWDVAIWLPDFEKRRGSSRLYSQACELLGTSAFFPAPQQGNRNFWLHPRDYVGAALADACESVGQVKAKIELLETVRNEVVTSTKDVALADMSVQKAGGDFFKRFGRKITSAMSSTQSPHITPSEGS